MLWEPEYVTKGKCVTKVKEEFKDKAKEEEEEKDMDYDEKEDKDSQPICNKKVLHLSLTKMEMET